LAELICVGMSHVHAVREGFSMRQQAGPVTFDLQTFILDHPPYRPAATFQDGAVRFNQEFAEDFSRCLERTNAHAVFAYLIGAEHFNVAFVNSPRPFDIILPGGNPDSLGHGVELIPYDLLLATFEYYSHSLRDWLPYLRELTDLPIYQIAPPPPIVGDAFMQERASGDLRKQIERYGIAAETLRSKAWQVCVLAFERQCAAYGVELIRAPAEALGETQCLLPQYRGNDVVHANAAYGSLLIDRMLQIERLHAGGKV
jgi:hypothetical protein